MYLRAPLMIADPISAQSFLGTAKGCRSLYAGALFLPNGGVDPILMEESNERSRIQTSRRLARGLC